MTATATDTSAAQSRPLSPEAVAYAGIALILSLVGAAVLTWGIVGLAMSALAAVPVMFTVLLLITVGK